MSDASPQSGTTKYSWDFTWTAHIFPPPCTEFAFGTLRVAKTLYLACKEIVKPEWWLNPITLTVNTVNGGLNIVEIVLLVGLFIVVIVAIQTIGDIVKRKYQFENRNDVSQEALTQIQADLNALQKSVDEMKEYLTDLYIQQHDKRWMGDQSE